MFTTITNPNRSLRSWLRSAVLPVLALAAGLAAARPAAAAVTPSTPTVVVSRNGGANETIGAATFDGSDLGSYDAATGQLLLKGGSLTTTETGNSVVNAASLFYTLYDPNGDEVANGSFALAQSGAVSGGVRTFTYSGGTVNLAGLAPTAGTGYLVSVSYQYRYRDNNKAPGFTINVDNGGMGYNATFDVTGSPVFTPMLTMTTALIGANGAAAQTYYVNPGTTPKFDGANLGTFDINTGRLLLDGGTATTRENGNNTVSNVTLYYRTRLVGSGGGAFSPVSLGETGQVTNGDGSRTRYFSLNTSAQNLLANISANSSYAVDLYLQANYSNGSTNATITDNNGMANYVATFSVTGTAIPTTVWTGGVDDNWFNPQNWSLGVPNTNMNARVPDFASGSTVQYPNIYSDVVKPATPAQVIVNPDGTTDNIPASAGYDNRGSGNAMVRDLTLAGSTQLQRSILRLISGRLDVFGDLNNPQGSFIQRSGGIISFKSQGNQTISGSINGFTKVEIDGGANSIKTLTNSFAVKAGGYLKFINGILQTDISLVSSNFVSFDGATIETSTGIVTPAAQLQGETETSYLRGFITTTQTASPGTTQSFSNIGLTLAFTGNDPGNVTVTRNNGGNYAPTAFGGGNPKPSIRRVFGVQPTNPNTNNGGLLANVSFRYLNNELVNLRTNSANPPDYTGSDDQNRLALYVSTSGGNTFSQLGRDTNTGNVLTKNGATTFATYTLSEQQTPLPVTLISFDARRKGADALVTWATATEISNFGFEVQVSTNGTTFTKLAFVPSQAINSLSVLTYTFLDEQSGKTGQRYYRLRQIDQDGTNVYSPVRVVSFGANDAVAQGQTTLTAYPNPFVEGDLPSVLVQSSATGSGTVQLLDVTGRQLSQQEFTSTPGTQQISLPATTGLQAGVYLAKVTLASGEVKTVRIQKR